VAGPILALDSVVKRYGSALGVGPVSLEVRPGELLTLLGPSGCGKTTTLHLIAGLLQPDDGTIRMGERDLTRVAPPFRDMGLVFQNYALFPHKTVFENVAFGLRMRQVEREGIRSRVRRMLDLVGLPGVEQRYPDQLSGGQRQRVALARALVIEPTVLLLDEPLSNLDALLRKRMRLELRELQQRLAITTIFVTHDQDEAFEISDRVVLLNAGRIEQIGSPEDLYDAPANRFVAEFVGEGSLFEGTVKAVRAGEVDVEVDLGVLLQATTRDGEFRTGEQALVLLRPERIELAPSPQPGRPSMRVTIAKRSFTGDTITFELTTELDKRLIVHKPSVSGFRNLAVGDKLCAMPTECCAIPMAAR
jgi:ABC-type Fe3+/spermidine/putrescine transport system ATPase subunit